jgi:hypothetical protein
MDMQSVDEPHEYVSYAEHCLKVTAEIAERESRLRLREMAAEWLRLSSAGVERPA